MRIAQVAPPFESIPPQRYGGTERVVSTLTEGLVRRGHQVTLFAAGDSHTRAQLAPTVDVALWHHQPPLRDFHPFWVTTLSAVWDHVGDFDVIHSHLDYWGYPLARHAGTPVLTTLHGRLDLPELPLLYQRFRDLPLVSISDAQRQPLPWANFVATIHHGIDLDPFTFNPTPGGYLAFLGRISPEKGLDTAIRVAQRAGWPLRIAAREPLPHADDPNARADWEYYRQEIIPLLADGRAELIGEVDEPTKSTFLRNAAALLFPIRWPEPFGLVMIEALACGTPVLALRRGSVPEVIDDGQTGFICADEDALVAAVGRIHELDRARCRATAEQRFSAERMVEQYEQVYQRLLLDDAATDGADLLRGVPEYALVS